MPHRLLVVVPDSFHRFFYLIMALFTAKETQEFAARINIEWKFSVSSAPWFGGFWATFGCVCV